MRPTPGTGVILAALWGTLIWWLIFSVLLGWF